MVCSCAVPTLVASKVDVIGTNAEITVRGELPTQGRFNLKFCGCCVPLCSVAATVDITDGTTTYKPVLTRCANNLTLGELTWQIRRFGIAHFCGSTDTPGTAVLLDKLCCAPTIYTDDSVAIRFTGRAGVVPFQEMATKAPAK